jgi:uncharacterized membrane protein YdjX (TVP38/TMEM64 family)
MTTQAASGRRRAALLKLSILAAGLVLAGLLLREVGLAPAPGGVDRWVLGQGLLGDLVFVAVGAAATAAGAPRQGVAFLGGYALGVVEGTALALAAQVLGCAVSYLWARAIGRGWAERRLAGRFGHRLRPLRDVLAGSPFNATLALRLLPVGNNLALNLLAGMAGVSLLPFLAGSGHRLPAADHRLRPAGQGHPGGRSLATRSRHRAVRGVRRHRPDVAAPPPGGPGAGRGRLRRHITRDGAVAVRRDDTAWIRMSPSSGAGPAGLAMACALAGSGLRVTLLERAPEAAIADPAFDGREIALTHRSQAILRDLGAWDRIPAAETAPLREAKVLNGANPLALRFAPGRDGEPLGRLVPNHLIRRALFETAAGTDAVLMAGRAVAGLSLGAEGAQVTLDGGEVVSARLVVAADSRFSEGAAAGRNRCADARFRPHHDRRARRA